VLTTKYRAVKTTHLCILTAHLRQHWIAPPNFLASRMLQVCGKPMHAGFLATRRPPRTNRHAFCHNYILRLGVRAQQIARCNASFHGWFGSSMQEE
jgi:hypothetical protein